MSYAKRRARRRKGAGAKAPEGAIVVGRWVGRQTSCMVSSLLLRGLFVLLFLTQWEPLRGVESLVSVLTKRGINSLKTGQSRVTNICTTSSPAGPQMRGNLNTRVLRAQGAFVRDGPSENSDEDF